jgi:hypothetical protein
MPVFRGLLNTSQSRRRASSQARPSTPKKPAVTGPSYSILGANTRFVGTLKTEGDVQVEDIFVGDITARGRVTLGKQASLDGDLICEQAVIAGLVKGDVTARRITVLGTGRILGEGAQPDPRRRASPRRCNAVARSLSGDFLAEMATGARRRPFFVSC